MQILSLRAQYTQPLYSLEGRQKKKGFASHESLPFHLMTSQDMKQPLHPSPTPSSSESTDDMSELKGSELAVGSHSTEYYIFLFMKK